MRATPFSSRAFQRRGDTGAVLVMVLLVMMALLGLGLTGLYLTTGSIQMNANINMRNQALQAAEVGLQRAKDLLNRQGLPGYDPDISSLLNGSKTPAGVPLSSLGLPDAIPTSTDDCLGGPNFQRGAVLREDGVTGCQNPSALFNCPLPSMSNPNDPSSLTSKGTYTVFIRQDQAECRLGGNLFGCESRATGTSSCLDGNGLPVASNQIVVIRSEGTASDKRTMVALEITMSRNRNAPTVNAMLATVCPAGQAGCDDNASVQQGITVSGSLTPPPPVTNVNTGTGTSASSGTGTGTGTSQTTSTTTSTGTGTSGPGTTGTSSGTGTGTGTGTATSAGTGTTKTGTSTSTSTNTITCLNYAVAAVAPCSGWTPGCITINSGSRVDGYNRSTGSYGGSNTTTADIAMTCPSSQTSCPNNCPSGCITGSVHYSQPSLYTVNSLPAPSYTSNWNTVTVPPNKTIAPAYYHEVDLNSGTLTLTAGNYVVNYLNLNGGTLYIDDSMGAVRLWVLSSVSPNSTVTVKSGNPADFWLIYNGTADVNNNTNNNFTGVFFAPGANVNLNYTIYGAVVGGKATLNGSAAVHYDSNLRCN
jgi:hypothetical protein